MTTERIVNFLLGVSVLCALTVTLLVVRREFAPSPTSAEWIGLGDATHLFETAPHTSGPRDAEIVMVEFFDFQCPACKQLSESIDSVRQILPTAFRVARHHYPLTQIHPRAQDLALIALCLPSDSVFDTFYERAFALQDVLSSGGAVSPLALIAADADTVAVAECTRDPKTWSRLQRELALGDSLKLRATPSFVIGGRLYTGSRSTAQLIRLLEDRR